MALQGKLESLLYIYVPNRLPPTKFDWYIPRDHARPAKSFPHVKSWCCNNFYLVELHSIV